MIELKIQAQPGQPQFFFLVGWTESPAYPSFILKERNQRQQDMN
jgi:hypothetical protein